MSRFRVTSSSSPVDREIQGQVEVAERALTRALNVCRAQRYGGEGPSTNANRVRRDIERALGALRAVRRVNPYGQGLEDEEAPVAPAVAPPPPPPEVSVTPPMGEGSAE